MTDSPASASSGPAGAAVGGGGGGGGGWSRGLGRRSLILGAGAIAVGGTAAVLRALKARRSAGDAAGPDADAALDAELDQLGLGWGDVGEPQELSVATLDGARLAVWDAGDAAAPTVVLPHCWGCSHAIWIPVARRLVESGHRVVLYDQRGHGVSTRGTAPLSIETLADDLAAVLEARDVNGVVLGGHSMGGMTVMSLATYRPEVLTARAKALVLVATAAADNGIRVAQAERLAIRLISSSVVSKALQSSRGHHFVRSSFGVDPVAAHVDLTRNLFGSCDGAVRGGYLSSMNAMNLLEGIATIDMPTTVMVGSRDRLTVPARAQQIADAVPGARLVTLQNRGHMLPLEDPDAVTDEIIRAVKG
jgi:non-heme chloroperoxidase